MMTSCLNSPINFTYFCLFLPRNCLRYHLTGTPLSMPCLGVLEWNFLGGKSGKCSGIDVELLISTAEEE